MDRYDIQTYIEFVKPLYDNKDTAHDFRHIQRIIKRLDLLSQGINEKPRLDLLYFLTSFHGLWKKVNNNELLRARSINFLIALGWSDLEMKEGFECLGRHTKNPQTIEEKIVHDANYIEILDAFGIAKIFITGGANGRSYEETIRIYEEEYLNKVQFQTPMGKKHAAEGIVYVKDFLKRLKQELEF